MMKRENLERKVGGLRRLIESHSAVGLVVVGRAGFAWLSGGGQGAWRCESGRVCACLLVTRDRLCLIASNVDFQRLIDEELVGLPFEPCVYSWQDGSLLSAVRRIVGEGPLLSDIGLAGTVNVGEGMASLRWVLDEDERDLMGHAGRIAAASVEGVARAIRPGVSELEIAGLMARETMLRGGLPLSSVVGSDERIGLYRNPVPTARRLERTVLLGLTVAYRGLAATGYRMACFGKLSADLRRRHEAACRIDAAMMDATRPGSSIDAVLSVGRQAFETQGVGEEYGKCDAGGLAGYEPLECMARPGDSMLVQAHQVFVWGSSLAGTRTGDSLLVGEKENELLTRGENQWPMVRVVVGAREWERPGILVG